jgi:capsular polysaccharide biosynthesis protein
MTLLMLDNETRQLREWVSELQERLYLELADERDQIAKELADSHRAQTEESSKIAEVELKLSNLRETKTLSPPLQSIEPVGPSAGVVMMLAVIVGLTVGMFAAFFAEFLRKVKQDVRDQALIGAPVPCVDS